MRRIKRNKPETVRVPGGTLPALGLMLLALVLLGPVRSRAQEPAAGPEPGGAGQISPSEKAFGEVINRALETQDPNICNEAEGYIRYRPEGVIRFHAQEAKNFCLMGYAKRNLDLAACRMIRLGELPPNAASVSRNLHDACLYDVQYLLEDFSADICREMENSHGWFFNQCVRHAAQQQRDPGLCRSLLADDKTALDDCLNRVASGQ